MSRDIEIFLRVQPSTSSALIDKSLYLIFHSEGKRKLRKSIHWRFKICVEITFLQLEANEKDLLRKEIFFYSLISFCFFSNALTILSSNLVSQENAHFQHFCRIKFGMNAVGIEKSIGPTIL